jgi:hypothetical protein
MRTPVTLVHTFLEGPGSAANLQRTCTTGVGVWQPMVLTARFRCSSGQWSTLANGAGSWMNSDRSIAAAGGWVVMSP